MKYCLLQALVKEEIKIAGKRNWAVRAREDERCLLSDGERIQER